MKFDIENIKRKMLVKYPFFGCVITDIKYKVDISIKTAATDGQNIFYNPNFLDSLTIEQQVFVIAHEVCHIAFNHILRSEGKIAKLWNKATDAVINAFLMSDGLQIVEGAISIKDAIKYDAEELYNKLLKEEKNNKQTQNNNSNNKETNDIGHDTHEMWEEAVRNHNKVEKRKELINKILKSKKDEQNKVKEKQKNCESLGELKVFEKNKEEKKKELDELKKSYTNESDLAGSHTSYTERVVSDVGNSRILFDWRYLLNESIKYEMDWTYNNAVIEDGVLIPHLEEYSIPETEIVIDTSGSINEMLLKNFLKECKNILHFSKLKIGCFDTRFYGFKEVKTEQDIDNMEFLGGGGTDFDAAVNAFTERVDNRIIFTDGHASMPKKEMDIIWIVFGTRDINPKGGRVIKVDKDDLDRLYFREQEFIRVRKK